ncbi:flagellar biosynthesis protein FlgJ [Pseudoduganella sp. DS3]|uniref:Flagellar biosynthesis protein FlgJ n=1 Tax=Pseudoduganella guangdongensis TaxID=2692179 RepID=A0A6N9HIG0_9BURK|nr:rod-binding protein [Pseudoduganella guangdongensis]MYN03388.1 flagellar biosynthesis protein FlgJ [Pseudoduganella guangdongensis]
MDSRFAPLPVRQLDIGSPAEPKPGQAAPAPHTDEARYRAKATEAAVKFESFFIAQALHKMRDATKAMAADDSFYKDSVNSDMLDMADNLVADQLANRRAFGVADAILRQLLPPAPVSPPENSVISKKKPTDA